MDCRFCRGGGSRKNPLVILPTEHSNLAVSAFGCVNCAIEKGFYCQRHDTVHQGFEGEMHACIGCIEDAVEAQSDRALDYLYRLREGLSELQYTLLEEVAGFIAAKLTEPVEMTILRYIMCKAITTGTSAGAVVTDVINAQDVYLILPPLPEDAYFDF